MTSLEREALALESEAEAMRQMGRHRAAYLLTCLAGSKRRLAWVEYPPPWTARRPMPRARAWRGQSVTTATASPATARPEGAAEWIERGRRMLRQTA